MSRSFSSDDCARMRSEAPTQGNTEGFPPLTVTQFFKLWLTERKCEIAPSTFDFYQQSANSFLRFLGDRGNRSIFDLDRAEIVAYRNELVARLSAKTVNHRVKTLRMALEYGIDQEILSANPAKRVKSVRGSVTVSRRAFTIDELRAILSVADAEWASMIRLGIYTGQRLGDISRLVWDNVCFESGIMRFQSCKTQRLMTIPLAPKMLTQLFLRWARTDCSNRCQCAIHPRAYKLVEKCGGRVASLSNQFANILASAGLRERIKHTETGLGRSTRRRPSQLCFHSLRHSTVSMLREAGASQSVTMEFVGHDSREVHHHYTHVSLDAMRKATMMLPSV